METLQVKDEEMGVSSVRRRVDLDVSETDLLDYRKLD